MFDLLIAGPGLQTSRRISEGQSVLIGRDTDCDLCLPDPERTVSRHHLALWVEAGQLSVRVLSSINGVDLPSGELPPGGVAPLSDGTIVMVGDYDITIRQIAPADSAVAVYEPSHEDDPFGEWGFDATVVQHFTPQASYGPSGNDGDSLSSGMPDPSLLQTRTVPRHEPGMEVAAAAFCRGLGLSPEMANAIGPAEMEATGRRLRIAVQALSELYASKLELNRGMGADERTMVATRENNPLKTDWPLETKLEFLVGAKSAGSAFTLPEIALADLVADLRVHDLAVTAASRAVVEGALREFEPEKVEARIASDKSQGGLMAKLRPWEAYVRFHAAESSRMAQWVERLFTRYFLGAYIRETTRIRNEAGRRN
jgi:predicted component of type VI protein secretion system